MVQIMSTCVKAAVRYSAIVAISSAVSGFAVWHHLQVPEDPGLPLSVPAVINGKVGRLAKIVVATSADRAFLHCAEGPDNPDLAMMSPKSALFSTPTAGDYHMVALAVVGRASYQKPFVIHIEGSSPPPAPPGPTPPPGPGPGPSPADPFLSVLKSAADKDNDKANIAKLADVYHQIAKDAGDSSIENIAQLYVKARQTALDAIGRSALPETRKALQTDIERVLPDSSNAPLDDATRKLAVQTFARLANDLDTLK